MQDIKQSRVASVIALLAGIWAAISPIWFTMTGGQEVSVIATGAVIALAALIQLLTKNAAPSWVNMLAAVWLFISAFSFAAGTAQIWNQAITAIVVFVVASWDGAEVSRASQHHHVGAM